MIGKRAKIMLSGIAFGLMASGLLVAEEFVYGSQMMTREELRDHRLKLNAAKTPEEQERLRSEHHEQMKQRAKEKGLSLPDMPSKPQGPQGAGPGGGRGRQF